MATHGDRDMSTPHGDMVPQDQAQSESELSSSATTIHYYGTVNNIRHAHNANFGENHGHITSQIGMLDILSPVSPPSEALRPLTDASHTRNRRTSPPDSICLPGTRTATIQRILSWSEGATPSPSGAHQSSQTHILWLCGPVGCGKSAIAQSIAEMVERRSCLAASFFFFRGSGSRGKFERLAVTLAAQIAVAIPATRPHINAALRAGAGMPGASVAVQLERLVYRPIEAVSSLHSKPTSPPASYLVVLDGLDECGDREDIEDFLEHMLVFFEEHPSIPLRFLISSRIEEHIRERIDSIQVEVVNLNDHGADDDIRAVVTHTFEVASKRNRVLSSLGYLWPDEEELDELIEHADGSFIFIRTLLNYILGLSTSRNDGLTPMDRFAHALGMHPGLDGLYSETLQRSRHIPHFKETVFTIALLYSPLSISDLSRLLDLPSYRVVTVLIPLQAIVRVPGADGGDPVTLFHTSLRDFVLDDQRSAEFFPPEWRIRHRDWIAHRCLELRARTGAEPLQYATLHWKDHWAVMAPGHETLNRQVDWITTLGQGLVKETSFATILPAFYLSLEASLALYRQVLDHPKLDISPYLPPVTPQDRALLEALMLMACRYPRLLLLELKPRLMSAPWKAPDSALHRQMITQSMRCITGNHTQYYEPTSPINSHLWAHIVLFWSHHLRMGIEGSASSAKPSLEFLEEPHIMRIGPEAYDVHVQAGLSRPIPLDRKILEAGLSRAYSAIPGKVLPVLLAYSLDGETQRAQLYRSNALTVLDVIHIFQHCLGLPHGGSLICLVSDRGTGHVDLAVSKGKSRSDLGHGSNRTSLYMFTISLDCLRPLGIPTLDISKTTTLQPHPSDMAALRPPRLGKARQLDLPEADLPQPGNTTGWFRIPSPSTPAEHPIPSLSPTAPPTLTPIYSPEGATPLLLNPPSPPEIVDELYVGITCNCQICERATREGVVRRARDRSQTIPVQGARGDKDEKIAECSAGACEVEGGHHTIHTTADSRSRLSPDPFD